MSGSRCGCSNPAVNPKKLETALRRTSAGIPSNMGSEGSVGTLRKRQGRVSASVEGIDTFLCRNQGIGA